MREAESYDEWKEVALLHDEESGAEDWKSVDRSEHYDNDSIRARLDHLRACRDQQDDSGLLFALNEGIHGNMGGMGSAALYEHAKVGTKHLIVSMTSSFEGSYTYPAAAALTKQTGHFRLQRLVTSMMARAV